MPLHRDAARPRAGWLKDLTDDTSQAIARGVIICCAVACFLIMLATALARSDTFTLAVWLPLPLFSAAFFLALRLIRRSVLVSQLILQVGLAAGLLAATRISSKSEVATGLAMLPLMGTMTLGIPGGTVATILMAALLGALRSGLLWPAPRVADGLALATIGIGVMGGALGAVSGQALRSLSRESLDFGEQMRARAGEARHQRLELRQVQDDLVKANQELARLSDRLRAMYQVAEEARRAKETFVANVSHELRTPLNMIIGFSEMIPKLSQVYGSRLPPALLSDIAAIRRNSRHLARLVDDVLDLSQVDSGRMALRREWVELSTILDEAMLAVRALYDTKGLTLSAHLPGDLPPVYCDATRIRQVVLNLLSNAGRFTDTGGVTVRLHRQDGNLIMAVSDTGPGIPIEARARIFEPFQQLDGSISRRHGGSGLGLAISRELVELHGGRMWLDSELGVGTTFYVSLPLATAPRPALAGAGSDRGGDMRRWFSPYSEWEYRARTRRSKAPTAPAAPRFVLLEDGTSLGRLLERYVLDVDVQHVESLEAGYLALRSSPAQALIVNRAPTRNGPLGGDGNAAHLGDLPFGTPAIGCWVPGEEDAARQLGVIAYLVKPISSDALLRAIERLGDGVRDILIVDDEPEALQLFTRQLALAPQGYRVIQATDGARALELLRERRPDAVLLDLVMPRVSGFDVLREMARDADLEDIPVIAISALDPQGDAIVSSALTVTRGGGLSVRDLLECIQALSEILAPRGPAPSRGRPEATSE